MIHMYKNKVCTWLIIATARSRTTRETNSHGKNDVFVQRHLCVNSVLFPGDGRNGIACNRLMKKSEIHAVP